MQIIYLVSQQEQQKTRNPILSRSVGFTLYPHSICWDGTRKIAVSNTLCGSRCNVQNCEQADAVPFITQIKDGRQFTC